MTTMGDNERFRIETTTVDGCGMALLACKPCSSYGYNVSSRIGGRVGDLFRTLDLAAISALAATHQCPPEVIDWATGAP